MRKCESNGLRPIKSIGLCTLHRAHTSVLTFSPIHVAVRAGQVNGQTEQVMLLLMLHFSSVSRVDPKLQRCAFNVSHFMTPSQSRPHLAWLCSERDSSTHLPFDTDNRDRNARERCDRSPVNEIPSLDMKDSMAKLFMAGKRPHRILRQSSAVQDFKKQRT